EVAGGFDGYDVDLIFNGKLKNVAVPIEIILPGFGGDGVNGLPCLVTEFGLVPGATCEAWNAEVDPGHVFCSPQFRHAPKSEPRTLKSPRIAIYNSKIRYSLER